MAALVDIADSNLGSDWTVDGREQEALTPLIRENNCVQMLTVLQDHDGEAWSLSVIAKEAMIPETTARRLLFPEVMELRSVGWLQSLRHRENLTQRHSAAAFTTRLVESY